MSEIKNLINVLLEKHGGLILRENNRTYWQPPVGEKYHISTVFLRRMVKQPQTTTSESTIPTLTKQKEIKLNVEKPSKEIKQEVVVNEPTQLKPQFRSDDSFRAESGNERESEEIPTEVEKTKEETVVVESPKKKKKSRPKKTKSKVDDAEKSSVDENGEIENNNEIV